jgi:hypothetical protein
LLSSTRGWTAIAILASVLQVATSASAALGSTARIAVAAPNDRAATQALLEADYRLAKSILVHFDATEAALARAAKTLGDECQGVLRGGPDESVLEEGPSASRPRLSGRAQGELARSELEKQTIDVEISESLSAATDRVLRRSYEAYVGVVASLVWSNPTINAVLRERMARLREDIAVHTVSVCADMRAWAASGFHVLPPASKRLEEARQARNQPPVQDNLHSLLQPYEDAAGRKILRRETAVEERLRERERDDEVYARADYQMKRALGEKVSSFQQQQFAPVIARGRTSAGTTFVIRANVGEGHSRSCKHKVNVEVIEHDGSGSGGSVCIGEGAHSQPSSGCSGSVETLELATRPDVHAARFRLGDGHTLMIPVVHIPAKYGGPAGVIIDAFRGYNRHPVSLQELSASGKIIRTVDLKRARCTKQSMSEGPGPPQFVTLATTTTPTGEPLVIEATLMHFRGQTEFSLGPPPGTRSAELDEENNTSKQFQWSLSTECAPHPYTLIDGTLTPPGASVLVRTSAGLVALTKVELASSIHAPGPLFYGVYVTPPTEIVVERSDGTILYTESLVAKATEAAQFCEGYVEP